MGKKLWNGGNADDPNTNPVDIISSDDIETDKTLIEYEIITLLAYQVELFRERKINKETSRKIIACLLGLRGKYNSIPGGFEDVHSFLQYLVTEQLHEDGANLRVLLSRNEEVHTDLRLFYRDQLITIQEGLLNLINKIKGLEQRCDGVIPGYTHYRQAMPVSIKTYTDAIACTMEKKIYEIQNLKDSLSGSPLGYGSGFGNLMQIDWEKTAYLLGFARFERNPMFSASERVIDDFRVLSTLTSVMIDMSRICQDIIFYSSDELGIFAIPGGFATGSSLMPNKRNPDFLEVLEGYSALFSGNLTTIIFNSINKLSGYHREFQIGKRVVVDTLLKFQVLISSLALFFSKLTFNAERSNQVIQNSIYATHYASSLLGSGLNWTESYTKTGERVRANDPLQKVDIEPVIVIDEKRIKQLKTLISTNRNAVEAAKVNLLEEARRCLS